MQEDDEGRGERDELREQVSLTCDVPVAGRLSF